MNNTIGRLLTLFLLLGLFVNSIHALTITTCPDDEYPNLDTPNMTGSTTNCSVDAEFAYYVNGLNIIVGPSAPSSLVTYLWDFGDGTTLSGAGQTHTYASPGTYPVSLTANDGSCSRTDTYFIVIGQDCYEPMLRPDTFYYRCGDDELYCGSILIPFQNDINSRPFPANGVGWSLVTTPDPSDGTITYNPQGYPIFCPAPTISDTVTLLYRSCYSPGCPDCDTTNITFITYDRPDANISFTNNGNVYDFTTFGQQNNYNVNWDFGDGNSSTQVSPRHTYATPGPYTVCLTVDNDNGCEDQNCFLIIVESACTETSVNPDFFGICEASTYGPIGFNVLQNDSGVDAATLTYLNNLSPALAQVSVSDSLLMLNNLAGNTPAVLTLSYSVSSGLGCPLDTQTVEITISDVPSASFLHTKNGLTVDFADQSVGTYQTTAWTFGDGATSTQANPQHTYATAGTYEVCFTVENDGLCPSTNCEMITVFDPTQCGSVTANSDQLSICASSLNGNLGIEVLANDVNADVSTLTYLNDLNLAVANVVVQDSLIVLENLNITAPLMLTFSYSVSSGPGCPPDTTTVSFNLLEIPSADFTTSINRLTVDFTNTSTGSYQSSGWNFGDGTPSTDQNPQHTYASSGTYEVCLKVTNDGLCENTICKEVTVSDACPEPEAEEDEYVLCGNTCHLLDVLSNDQNVDPSTLSFNNDLDPAIGQVTVEGGQLKLCLSPEAEGTIVFSYTVCAGPDPCFCADANVNVQVIPAPTAIYLTNVNGLTLSFANQSTGNITSYFWQFGDGNTSTQSDPQHTYSQPGTYTVCLTVTNEEGCSDTLCQDFTVFGEPAFTVRPDVYIGLGRLSDLINSGQIMVPGLNLNGLVPMSDPYSGTQTTTEAVLARTEEEAIIDWICIQLRSVDDPAEILYTKAGLLQANGRVIDANGEPFYMGVDEAGAYFLLVYHRTHLAVLIEEPISFLEEEPVVLDILNGGVNVFGGNNALQEEEGFFFLVPGDSNGDGQINAVDNANWIQQNGQAPNYEDGGDFNLDGQKNAADRAIWIQNSPRQVQLPFPWN